ncbi:MAG: hypothetical protein RL757_509 [Bacteroidota bacterium]|jgi:hypothetical protein
MENKTIGKKRFFSLQNNFILEKVIIFTPLLNDVACNTPNFYFFQSFSTKKYYNNMKITKFLFLFVFAFTTTQMFAQKGTNLLKLGGNFNSYGAPDEETLNPIGFGAAFEHAFNDKQTIGFNVEYGKKTYNISIIGTTFDASIALTALELEGRHYFKEACNGFYLGLSAGGVLVKSAVSFGGVSESGTDTWFSMAAKLGYQVPLSPKAFLQIGGTGGFVVIPNGNTTGTGSSSEPRLGVNLMVGFKL